MNMQVLDAALHDLSAPSLTRPSIAWWRRIPRGLLAAGAAVGVATAGASYIVSAPARESTDDAYIQADVTSVAPKVRGLVAQVLVTDNQSVHAGEPLVRIDSEEFDARVASARAELLDAQAVSAGAQAALSSLDAEERLAS